MLHGLAVNGRTHIRDSPGKDYLRVYEQSPLQVKEVDNCKLMKTPGQHCNYHDYSDCTDTNVRTQLD